MWNLLPKPMNQRQSNHCDVENQDTADVGDTGVEGLGPLFLGGNSQDTLEYQYIGDEDDHRIQHKYKDHKHNWIQSIEGGVSTGQFDDILVKAECMGEDMGMAIRKKIKRQDWRDNRYKPPHQNSQPNFQHLIMSEYRGISKGVANGNKAIVGHSKQNTRLYKGK